MKKFFSNHFIPHWIILLIDILLVAFSVFISIQVRFNFKVPDLEYVSMKFAVITIIATRLILFLIFGSYKNIIRYTSTSDTFLMVLNLIIGSVFFVFLNILFHFGLGKANVIPYSIVIIELLMTTGLVIGYRILLKITFLEIRTPSREKTGVVIFGAGESGVITKRAIDRDAGSKYKVIAFFDDDPQKIGKKIEGVSILNSDKIDEVLQSNNIAHLIISVQKLRAERRTEIIDICLKNNVKALIVPHVSKWINGELSFKQIRKINIEELLERDVIQISNKKVSQEISDKTVLVTGAAGSIGSELMRQIIGFYPKLLVGVDQAETPVFELQNELQKHSESLKIIVANICDSQKMRMIFEKYKPVIVFHAAAYKHVPIMETNPAEAIKNNVFGTRLLANLAMEFGVEKFIFISTDKAVNPTNIMGASKRIAEMYIQAHDKKNKTKFITTRFGNVLGSNGSVIPLFRRQIEKGGPVTVTDPEVTRFFMTIPEAVSLVLEAGTMGNGGEIFIFDMGESVKIIDLAKKMIQLSGYTIGKDIQIVFTGMRPGEKLYEELLADKENNLPTYHNRILIAKVQSRDVEAVETEIEELIQLVNSDNMTIVEKMKKIVPEFKSKNSIFEKLDKK